MGLKDVNLLGAGIAIGMIVSACATPFPYHGFGLDLKGQKLLGPTPDDDLPLSTCDSTPSNASPCTVLMTQAYLELKKAYLDQREELISCQAGNP